VTGCHVTLRGCWHDDIVLNVYASTEDKSDDMKDIFYNKLQHVFDQFPKYHTKILSGDFNAKVGAEDIFKPTIRNESLHEISNDNGVTVVNLATSKNLNVKSTISHITTFRNTLGLLPMGKHNHTDHVLIDKSSIQIELMTDL